MIHKLFTVCFLGCFLISCAENDSRKITIYNKSTLFQLFETEVETDTLIIISPPCEFNSKMDKHDCKKYIKTFIDFNCSFSQTNKSNTANFLLFMSPESYNTYDARIDIKNITQNSWIQLAQGLSCQSNNLCVFVSGFTFSYKDWSNVPVSGNNVTLNCSKFHVYAYS